MHSLDMDIYLKRGIATMQCQSQNYTGIHSEQLTLSSEQPPYHPSPPWISHHGCWKLQSHSRGSHFCRTLNNQSDPQWTLDPNGLLCHLDASMFWTPAISTMCSPVLAWPIPCSHFGQTKTSSSPHAILLSRLSLCQEYCKWCTTCSHVNLCTTTLQISSTSNSRSLGIPYPCIS